jgi:hypothetical protein
LTAVQVQTALMQARATTKWFLTQPTPLHCCATGNVNTATAYLNRNNQKFEVVELRCSSMLTR